MTETQQTPDLASEHLVDAVLFNERGTYNYSLLLDYSFQTQEDFEHWDLREQAVRALKHGKDQGTSGVAFEKVPEGWTLVAMDPRSMNSFPVMVRGGFVGLADALYGSRRS